VKTNVKFDRRVNIRSRMSNRKIFWCALAAAAGAYVVFFGLFSLRAPEGGRKETYSALTMLSSSDFSGEQREGFRNWMEYHDPRHSIRGEFDEDVVSGTLRDVRPPGLKSSLAPDIPVRFRTVGRFREVPGGKLPVRTLPPAPPRAAALPVPVSAAAGRVTDGEGNILPLGSLKLPPRSSETAGRTILRVFNGGRLPALLLEESCGDAALDGFAIRSLTFLALREAVPEFIIVEWPEAGK